MLKPIHYLIAGALAAALGTAQAKTIVVNTVDNTDFSTGKTNLVYALQNLSDGDTIGFAIPGAGVHTIDTPPDGYPLITANNITIDGYSQNQTGSVASPNTASIHAANNAQLMICLSSKNGNALSMYHAVTNYAGVDYPNLGFGDGEQAILGFFKATNAWVKGIAFLAPPTTSTTYESGGDCKTICFAVDAPDFSSLHCQGAHISGCWFGVDPVTRQVAYLDDGTTVATPTICIATYNTGTNGTPGYTNSSSTTPGDYTIGVGANSTNPRAEFNVFVTGYGFDSQGGPFRISGNFWGVLPDGVTLADITTLNNGDQQGDAFVEFGGSHDILIGTDGDGVNDADEANIFGAYTASGNAVYYYGSQGATVIAGNTFGADIHGNTFGVGMSTKLVHKFKNDATSHTRFGSDFNGVSDALEGNYVADCVLFDFDTNGSTNSNWISMRGNSLTNTATPSFSRPPIGDGQGQPSGQTTYSQFMDLSGPNGALDIIPIIGTGTTPTKLSGTCANALTNPFTRVIVDLYLADPSATSLPQGMKWLGSYTDNSSADQNPAKGAFTFDISSLGLNHGAQVVIAVTYSRDTQPVINSIQHSGGQTTLTITNSTGPNFGVLKASKVSGPYTYVTAAPGGSASFADAAPASFYRATGPTATGQTSPFSDIYIIP